MRALPLGLFFLAAALPPALAQTAPPAGSIPGDPDGGRVLARTWCVNCHVVDAQSTQPADGVPSFPAIARMPSTTQLSLQAFLQTPHTRMPNFQLTRQQVDDAVAYILSLRR